MPNPCLLRDWTDSRKVNALDAFAERYFLRLLMKNDDYGRIPNDAMLLKSRLFPLLTSVRETDISRWGAECARAGLIRFYVAVNGRSYIEVLNFGQRKKWMKSEHPPPEGQIGLAFSEKTAPGYSRSRRGVEERDAGGQMPEDGCRRANGNAITPIEEIKNGLNGNGHAQPSHLPLSRTRENGSGATDAPRARECWQLLKDEENLTVRIRKEAGSTQPDGELIAALKLKRTKVREEMKLTH